MKKALLIAVPLAGAVAIGMIACRKAGGCRCHPGRCCGQEREGSEEGRERPDIWAKMEQKMARMPETFPPRMMFDNIAVIREQTTRILELLEPDAGRSAGDSESPGDAT